MVLPLSVLKTVKHYFALGAYLGVFLFIAQLVKDWTNASKAIAQGDLLGLLGIGLLLCLFCGCVGGLVGWLKAYAEKRRRRSNESLIVRR